MTELLCPACGQGCSEFDSLCPACGTALPSQTHVEGPRARADDDPILGRQISHFRVVRLLGRGGMGVVYQAVDLELGRDVALKFLSSPRSTSARDEIRFRREAQATAALDHPNIGTVHEIGEHEGRRFIAMAFYGGETLAARLKGRPGHRLPAAEAAAIAGQLASALAAAHAAGVVHRDLKPDNVMILPDGRVKLLDFGLAKWVDSPTVTEKGFAVGTAAYMAPEQFQGEESGPASDLWALGAVLYEMLAGARPFGGEKKGMVHAILHEDPPALRGLRPDVPEALERIATRCLAKEPGDRYPDTASVLTELAAAGLWGSGSSGSAPFAAPRRNRSRWPWLAAAALLLLAAGAAAFFLTRSPKPPVYVAVLKPEVTGSLLPDDAAQVRMNLQAALLRTVAALDGLAALDAAQVDKVKGPPVAVARAVAAGEVVAARADCTGDQCQVSLSRLAGNDGRVLWTEALQLPLSKPRLFADAVAVALRQGYGDRDLRLPRIELETSEEDYRTYLDLRRQAADPAAYQGVLERLGALRNKAPDFLETYSLEANVALRLYDLKGDKRYLERGIDVASQARERAPGDPRPLANLFDLYLMAGSYPQADAVLAQLAAADPAGSLLRRGKLAERRGSPQEALELLAEAVSLQPSWRSLLILANTEYRQGRLDDARRHLADLLRRAPGNIEGLKALAQIELLIDPGRALVLLRQIAATTPDVDSLINLGVALLLQRQYGEAEESFRNALQLQPGSPSATLDLADCLLLQGRGAEARALYAEIVAQAERANRGDWENLGIKAQALAHLGDPTRAVEAIQQALRLTPDNAQLAYEAAVVYTVVGDQNSALVHAQRAAAGGVDAYWFALSFFDPLRSKPAFQALTSPTKG
jgi:tetratricopeptide (TPR) repeat protein